MGALWNLGFRPFYLAGAVYASAAVLVWVLQYAAVLPAGPIRGAAWHAHEMLFGFTLAIIAGFLFTAVRNWTQRPTPSGAALAALVALWAAGRVLAFTPFALAAGALTALFALAVAIAIARPLVAAGNRRNYFFVALLAGLAAAAMLFHLAGAGLVAWPAFASLRAGLDIVLFVVAVVAGRVIPMFTNNGVPGAGAERRAWLERASLAALLAVLAADLLALDGIGLAALAAAAAVLHAGRLALWKPWRTFSAPLVWSLHAAYAWIAVHLVLRALAAMEWVPAPLATHALTIGVIGGMTLAMMTRTARGHSGRPLIAGAAETGCYLLVHAAALARVALPFAMPQAYAATVVVSGLCWSFAYLLYAVAYWPVLTRPRIDGKPG